MGNYTTRMRPIPSEVLTTQVKIACKSFFLVDGLSWWETKPRQKKFHA
jgi:hypothetical protein